MKISQPYQTHIYRFVACLISILYSCVGFAHSSDLSTVRVELDNPAKVEIFAHSGNFGEAYAEVLATNLKLLLDGEPVAVNSTDVELDSKNEILYWETELDSTPTSIVLSHKLFPEIESSYTIVSVSENATLLNQKTLKTTTDSFDYKQQNLMLVWLSSSVSLVWQGMKHIFTGFDHVLFLLGLLLLGGKTSQLIKVISAFTIAHAATFWLAAMGVVNPPATIVEPIIALSVVIAALANLRPQASETDLRPAIAFVFGLIHGFGFAGLLSNLGFEGTNLLTSFLAFAVGLELGQFAIAACIVPVLAFIAVKWQRLRLGVRVVGSLGISIFGVVWFVERLGF